MSGRRLLAELLVPGVEASVPLLRHCVGRILATAGHRYVDDVRLVVSELASNAVTHTRSGRSGGCVIVEVSAIGDTLARIEVTDEGSCSVPRPREARDSDCDGRGLRLVEAMSVRWGVRQGPVGGTVVWAEVVTAVPEDPQDEAAGDMPSETASVVEM
ncbi:ATP-binding protein [Nonomuraea sp. B12E4]|uniref:ATP-binding protein n=1 Tax=Nonomuraea sp. B12E4 TaxID=3153564 RepID=UPI00325CDED1